MSSRSTLKTTPIKSRQQPCQLVELYQLWSEDGKLFQNKQFMQSMFSFGDAEVVHKYQELS